MTIEEANNFKVYLQTKFLRALVSAIKITQSAPNKVYKFVPVQIFDSSSDINWSATIEEIDEYLFKKYSLTEEEKEFVRKNYKYNL